MKKILLILILLLIIGGIFLPVHNSAAATINLMNGVRPECWTEGEGGGRGDCNVCDGLRVVYNVGKFVFVSMTAIALIMILWAGIGLIFNWGSTEAIVANKKLILHTLLAVLIILAAYALVDVLMVIYLGADLSNTEFWSSGVWYKGPDCK